MDDTACPESNQAGVQQSNQAGVQRLGQDRIDELVGMITSEFDLAQTKTAAGFEHFARIGEMLVELKAELGHGSWERWVDEESGLPFSHRQAQKYMKLFKEKEKLAKANSNSLLTIDEACAILAEPRKSGKGKARPRGKNSKRDGEGGEPEFEPPDLAHVVRHLLDRTTVSTYDPDERGTELLEHDLPVLLPALVDLGDRIGVETGVRLLEPDMPTTIEGGVSDAELIEDDDRCSFCRKAEDALITLDHGAVCRVCLVTLVGHATRQGWETAPKTEPKKSSKKNGKQAEATAP